MQAHVVAVASGKGGVGKSSLAANLAAAFSGLGHRMGVLDADVYGPSIPTIMGVTDPPKMGPDQRMSPAMSHGIKIMSIGFFIKPDQAVVWRGPMLHKTVQQFLESAGEPDRDVLLSDRKRDQGVRDAWQIAQGGGQIGAPQLADPGRRPADGAHPPNPPRPVHPVGDGPAAGLGARPHRLGAPAGHQLRADLQDPGRTGEGLGIR